MINFKEELLKEFIKGGSHWVSEDNCKKMSCRINNWQDKRIYLNIFYHTASFSLYVDINTKAIVRQIAKNSSTAQGLKYCEQFINNNLDDFIKQGLEGIT